jgi:acyl carrier protein
LFAEFIAASAAEVPVAAANVRDELLALPAGRARRVHLETCLQQHVAQVLKLTAARIDRDKALRTMGLDSLMGLELRNRLEAATNVTLPATLIWNYPTISQLAPQVAARMGVALDEVETVAVAEPATPQIESSVSDVNVLLQEIEGLSDEDVRRMLAEEA